MLQKETSGVKARLLPRVRLNWIFEYSVNSLVVLSAVGTNQFSVIIFVKIRFLLELINVEIFFLMPNEKTEIKQ